MSNLIISPHLDDAILSLGGFLTLMQKQNCKVITIFNTAWSIDTNLKEWRDITRKNLAEEREVMEQLKCDFEFLDFPEALLRGYARWNDALDMEKEYEVFRSITECLSPEIKKYDNIFFPRGIGNHVDHLLIKKLSDNASAYKDNIFFYEDLPYSCYEELEDFEDSMEILIDISRVYENKVELLEIYKSQLRIEQIEMVKKHSLRLGKGRKYCERIWKLLE